MAKKIKLGHWYKDTLTDIEGAAVAHERHLTGCDRIQLRTTTAEGDQKTLEFDITRLKRIKDREPVMEHTPVKSLVKFGEEYIDRTTGIVGKATNTLERLGLAHMLVSICYPSTRTGMPHYAHVDEPWLSKIADMDKASARVQEKAAEDKKQRGPGPSMPGIGATDSMGERPSI